MHLRRTETQVDTLLESEDGAWFELVHGQIMSAFGDKLTEFIRQNGEQISSEQCAQLVPQSSNNVRPRASNKLARLNSAHLWAGTGRTTENIGRVKRVRLAKTNKYTLSILVECAYTGYIRADLNSGGIWQVLDVAQHYEMADVIRACCNFLASNLDRSNCIRFYHIGLRHHNPLLRGSWYKIRANFKYILAEQLEAIGGEGEGELGERPGLKFNESLASLRFEHFENLLSHDKLNVDNEESVWYAIKLWCRLNPNEADGRLAALLGCMRFPRFRTGTDFSARYIWRDPLVLNSRSAQQQLAILDRNHRDFLASSSSVSLAFDGYSLPCAPSPRQLRPRVPNSILLAIGGWQQGQPTRLIESYDSNCNLWFQSRRRIMSPLAYHGIENINGLLYICGGTDGNEILNEVFTFDPLRGDCTQRASMREPRCYVSTACLSWAEAQQQAQAGQHFLYALGGHNGNQRMKSVERYSVRDDQWSHVQDMNVARSDASACVHNSLIYIAGGLNDQVIESSCEFYNQLDDSWTFISSMLVPRTSFSLLLYRNSLLAIGGNNGSARLASVEQYNFSSKQWSSHSLMKQRRSTFSAALLDQDKLIVVGGYNGQTPFNQVEMYDEATHSWHSIQKIRFDRSGLKVVVVSELANACEYSFAGSLGEQQAAD